MSSSDNSDFEGYHQNIKLKFPTTNMVNEISNVRDLATLVTDTNEIPSHEEVRTATENQENQTLNNIELDNDNIDNVTKRKSELTIFENMRYKTKDTGPYRIMLEILGDNYINKLAVAKIIKKHELGDKPSDIKKTGRKKVTIYMETMESANNMLNSKHVFEPKYVAYLPSFFVAVKGVITGIPVDMTIDEIKEEIVTNLDIIDIYRMNRYRDGIKVPSDRVCISFRSSLLPQYIKLYYVRSQVEPYIPKVVFCKNCLRFNHLANNCKGKQKCRNCSRQNCEDTKNKEECKKTSYCLYCKTNHRTLTKPDCNELSKQKQIKTIMATRSLSYTEVKDEYEYFLQNQFTLIDPDNEPIKIFEQFAKKKNNTLKKHKTITRIEKQTQCDETSICENTGTCRKRNREEFENGVALENPFKATEYEKIIIDLKVQIYNYQKNHKQQINRILYNIVNKDLESVLQELKNFQAEEHMQLI